MKSITFDFTVRQWRIIAVALATMPITKLRGSMETNRREIYGMIDTILNETRNYDGDGNFRDQ